LGRDFVVKSTICWPPIRNYWAIEPNLVFGGGAEEAWLDVDEFAIGNQSGRDILKAVSLDVLNSIQA
jgi:hypothetical protein